MKFLIIELIVVVLLNILVRKLRKRNKWYSLGTIKTIINTRIEHNENN